MIAIGKTENQNVFPPHRRMHIHLFCLVWFQEISHFDMKTHENLFHIFVDILYDFRIYKSQKLLLLLICLLNVELLTRIPQKIRRLLFNFIGIFPELELKCYLPESWVWNSIRGLNITCNHISISIVSKKYISIKIQTNAMIVRLQSLVNRIYVPSPFRQNNIKIIK